MLDFLKPKVPQISVDDVRKSLDAKEKITIIDVRTPEEYKKAHILGSINIPVDEIVKKIPARVADKQQKIYVYCLSGSRSVFAVSMMVKLGYTNIFNVTSGLLAWRVKQYPLET
jgi:rhodanese-related sulfurtransferase